MSWGTLALTGDTLLVFTIWMIDCGQRPGMLLPSCGGQSSPRHRLFSCTPGDAEAEASVCVNITSMRDWLYGCSWGSDTVTFKNKCPRSRTDMPHQKFLRVKVNRNKWNWVFTWLFDARWLTIWASGYSSWGPSRHSKVMGSREEWLSAWRGS